MKTEIRIFNRVQSYNRDFSKLEAEVNVWIADMEAKGGEVIDVRVQCEGLGDKFVWVMYSITIIYFCPDAEGQEKGQETC